LAHQFDFDAISTTIEVILKIIGEIIIPARSAGMMISPDVFWITSGDTLETR
jgi:hypothetical protein